MVISYRFKEQSLNVCAITEHFFGTEIKWSRKRKSISEATLVGAVAYKR